MVERSPLSDRIHKTTTSRIALIGLAAATMMITVSMIGAIQLQQASAAKPQVVYCFNYTISGTTSETCAAIKATCESVRSQTAPEYNPTRCHREKV